MTERGIRNRIKSLLVSKGICTPDMIEPHECDHPVTLSYEKFQSIANKLEMDVGEFVGDAELYLTKEDQYLFVRAMVETKQYEKAMPHLDEITKNCGSFERYLHSSLLCAECFVHAGKLTEAESMLEELIHKVDRKEEFVEIQVRVLQLLSMLQFKKKMYEISIKLYKYTLQIFSKHQLKNDLLKADILFELALAYFMVDARQNIECLNRSLQFYFLAGKSRKYVGQAYFNLANSFGEGGQKEYTACRMLASTVFSQLNDAEIQAKTYLKNAIKQTKSGNEV